jgi:hypothetical protein
MGGAYTTIEMTLPCGHAFTVEHETEGDPPLDPAQLELFMSHAIEALKDAVQIYSLRHRCALVSSKNPLGMECVN